MTMEGRRVLVVGAGSGIVLCVAVQAARAGASVVLAGRSEAALRETGALLPDYAEVVGVDAGDEAQVVELFRATGPFDHLVSTAGQGVTGPVPSLHAEAVQAAFGAKLWAPFFLVKHGAALVSPSGSFTFFSGFRSARPGAGSGITSLVNGGLEAFARAMALELAPVRVNVISPGIVDSGAFWDRLGPERRGKLFADFAERAPARHVGRPEDQAAAALFAAGNAFVTGAVLPVDGGALLM